MLTALPASTLGLIFVLSGLTFAGICLTRFLRAVRSGADTMVRPIDELDPVSTTFIVGAAFFAAAVAIHRGSGIQESLPMVVTCALPFVLVDWAIKKRSTDSHGLARRILAADLAVTMVIVFLVGYLHQSP